MKGIYCIENLSNGKKYYGSSMNIDWRLEQHRRGLRKGNHINVYLQRSYNVHGINSFSFHIVEDMGNPSKKELQDLATKHSLEIKSRATKDELIKALSKV